MEIWTIGKRIANQRKVFVYSGWNQKYEKIQYYIAGYNNIIKNKKTPFLFDQNTVS